jgi:multidrug efflux pump subunit AcrA (membrane-fusion protein)
MWKQRLFILAAALVAVGCGRSSEPITTKTAEEKPVKVTVADATTRQVAVYIQSSGSFVADESSDVAPLIAGRIASTPVDVGTFVKEGQVLATLDDSDARLRLQQAQAAQAQSEAALRQSQSRIGATQDPNFDINTVPEVQAAYAAYQSSLSQARLALADAKRYENLVATGDVSRSNYEKQRTAAETAQAQADASKRQYEAALNNAKQNWMAVGGADASLAGARSQVAIARKAVEDAIIRAPMAGYVSERPVAVGEYVATTAKIATILRANPIKLQLQVSESEASRLKPGMSVNARVSAYLDRDFTGRVNVVRPAIDPTSRSLTVEAMFTNPDFKLRPGMFATARIVMPGGEEGVFVPTSAVLTDATTSSSQVFVIENQRAHAKVVRLGETENGVIRVLAGVPGGAKVATGNLKDLFDGVAVLN